MQRAFSIALLAALGAAFYFMLSHKPDELVSSLIPWLRLPVSLLRWLFPPGPGRLPAIITTLVIGSWLLFVFVDWDCWQRLSSFFYPVRYNPERVSNLRSAAVNLRDVAWGAVPLQEAVRRIGAFNTIADDFVRRPELSPLLTQISHGATRLAAMSTFPPVGPDAPDPQLQNHLLNATHLAIDRLLELTDVHVIYAPSSDGRPSGA